MSRQISPISDINYMLLEMGYQCNIRCDFCFQEHFSPSSNMKPEVWKEKLLPVYGNLKRLTFHGGEPTIMREAREFSTFIIENYPAIKLDTVSNGLCFDKGWSEKFIHHGHKIIFSLNAASEAAYGRVTRNSDWGKVIGNIRGLVKLRDAAGSKLAIEGSFVITPGNIRDMAGFIELCAGLGFEKAFFVLPLFHNFKDADREGVFECLKQAHEAKSRCGGMKVLGIEPLIKRFFPGSDAERNIEMLKEEKDRPGAYYDEVCGYPWHSLFVNHSGDVSTCCFSWFPIGNINRRAIEEIWNGRQARSFRRKVACGDYSRCKGGCSFNINPSRKGGESRKVMAQNVLWRLYRDPKMAVKKLKKQLKAR